MAAPVGVVSSASTGESASGTPRSNSAVAGAGTLHTPWAIRMRPLPTGTADAPTHSTSNRSNPTAAPTTSAIECADFMEMDFFDPRAMDAGLGLSQARKNRSGELPLPVGQLPAVDHRQDVAQVAMAVLGLMFHDHLRGAIPALVDGLGDQPTALQPARRHRGIEPVQWHPGIDQRAEGHIAADTAQAVKIGDSGHGS